MKPAAQQGGVQACYQIAIFYAQGLGTRQSWNQAFKYFYFVVHEVEDAVLAQRNLAICYQKGLGCEQSLEDAFHYFQLAADGGDTFAQRELGLCYENGEGSDPSIRQAFKYYDLASSQDAKAQYYLANLFEWGKGTKKSSKKAFLHHKRAAKQSYGPAQIKVGDYYAKKRNFQEAVKYYQKAAEQKYAEAQYKLAYFQIDLSKAFSYYQLAADKGYGKAMLQVGFCFEKGLGIDVLLFYAFFYYKKAAQAGNAEGQCYTAHYYSCGLIVERSIDKAIYYYNRARVQGYKKKAVTKQIELCKKILEEEEIEKNFSNLFKLAESFDLNFNKENTPYDELQYYKLIAENGYKEGWRLVASYLTKTIEKRKLLSIIYRVPRKGTLKPFTRLLNIILKGRMQNKQLIIIGLLQAKGQNSMS